MLFLPDYFAHDKVIFGKHNFSSLLDPTGIKKKVKRLIVGPTYHLSMGGKAVTPLLLTHHQMLLVFFKVINN